MSRTAEHNLRCIDRARQQAEAGNRPLFSAIRKRFDVASATTPDRLYEVWVEGLAGKVRVACTCEAGHHQPPIGSVPCWHGAACCLVLEAAGLVRFDGEQWVLTGAAPEPVPMPLRTRPACPLCGTELDDLVELPVELQVVEAGGRKVHRRCRDRCVVRFDRALLESM